MFQFLRANLYDSAPMDSGIFILALVFLRRLDALDAAAKQEDRIFPVLIFTDCVAHAPNYRELETV
jgi:hypothetical protein